MFEIPISNRKTDSNGKKNASIVVGLVIINVCKFRRPGGDPGFLDRGFKFIKGGSIC